MGESESSKNSIKAISRVHFIRLLQAQHEPHHYNHRMASKEKNTTKCREGVRKEGLDWGSELCSDADSTLKCVVLLVKTSIEPGMVEQPMHQIECPVVEKVGTEHVQ